MLAYQYIQSIYHEFIKINYPRLQICFKSELLFNVVCYASEVLTTS